MLLRRTAVSLLLSLSCLAAQQPAHQPDPDADAWQPWTLQRSLFGAESDQHWLQIKGHTRVRIESIFNQFRSNPRLDNDDTTGFQRTSLQIDARSGNISGTVELLDSRHYGGSRGSALNTGAVNAVDILQANVLLHLGDLGTGTHEAQLGRYTIDLGSRRFLSRNGYRNTINSYTGANWRWTGEETAVTAFWALPVRRLPADLESVVDNDVELDDQDRDLQYFGGHVEQRIGDRDVAEAYTLFFLENAPNSQQRELITPGLRYRRKPERGGVDFEIESVYQFGESQTSRAGTGPDLDHVAWFQHASVGYMHDSHSKTRWRLAIDYASGDERAGDGQNNRFDTLLGSRGFDYGGPTGLWGAIARANILSPEARVTWEPRPDMHVWLAWRGVWLASDTDAWTTAGVADPTGNSGRHVGQQLTARWRWWFHERHLLLDVGAAHLFDGGFQRRAPGGQGQDSSYLYTAFTWKF